MTAEHLRKVERAYQAAQQRAETKRSVRNGAIAEALAEGWSHAKIAEATSMTRARVGQLALSLRTPVI